MSIESGVILTSNKDLWSVDICTEMFCCKYNFCFEKNYCLLSKQHPIFHFLEHSKQTWCHFARKLNYMCYLVITEEN